MQTLEEQVRRAYQQYCSRPDALAKNTFMTSLKYVGFLFCLGVRSGEEGFDVLWRTSRGKVTLFVDECMIDL